MKRKLTLSIEEEVLQSATERIPNISKFVEDCLKEFLGYNAGNYPTKDARDIIDSIGRSQVELHILNEQNKIEDNLKSMEQEKIDKIWRDLYLKYREDMVISDSLMNETSNILGVSAEVLEDILDCVDDSNQFFNTWAEVKQWYGEKQ